MERGLFYLPQEINMMICHQHLKDGMTLNIDGMVVSTMLQQGSMG